MKILKETLSVVLSMALMLATMPVSVAQEQTQDQSQAAPQEQENSDQPLPVAPPPPANKTPQDLDQMVAPIALYPDALVAQILAAATYPDQVVEADRWVDAHPDLKGKALADAVNQQPWDPSVKALTAFPSVLANMDKNLSWTSSLGEAYVNQQQDVMDAVQRMRQRAEDAGNLKSNSQENVKEENGDIEVEPTSPDIVYVPEYDPWLVYGPPLVAWPGWYWYPGLYFVGPGIGFGFGFGIGWFGGFGWGWHHWGFDWGRHYMWFNHAPYYTHSAVIFNHDAFYRARAGFAERGFAGPRAAAHGFAGHEFTGGHTYAQPHNFGMRSGAFSGFGRNGAARSFSFRGRSSFGGFRGGGFHGGGFHGGGFHGGGRR
jgi:hypothetical protein